MKVLEVVHWSQRHSWIHSNRAMTGQAKIHLVLNIYYRMLIGLQDIFIRTKLGQQHRLFIWKHKTRPINTAPYKTIGTEHKPIILEELSTRNQKDVPINWPWHFSKDSYYLTLQNSSLAKIGSFLSTGLDTQFC